MFASPIVADHRTSGGTHAPARSSLDCSNVRPPLECRLKHAPPRPGLARPRVEQLEEREVLSLCIWTGTADTAFDNPANWQGTVPVAGDDVVIGPQVIPFPGTEEDPPHNEYVSVACSGMHGAIDGDGSGEYNSVTVQSPYTSTVTLASGFTTKAFQLLGGTVNEPTSSPNTDITVIGGAVGTFANSFFWSGGTLNGTSNVATVTMTGSSTTGLIAPTNAGTVSLGSNITLDNGAVLTAAAGTINLLNDGWLFNINENSGLNVDPGAPYTFEIASSFPIYNGVQLNIIRGWVKVVSGSWNNLTPLKMTGGSLTLESGTYANFSGSVDNQMNGPSVLQAAGNTVLAADAKLHATVGMLMSGGNIIQKTGTKPQDFQGNILGNLTISGGDILFENMASGDNHEFGEFKVQGGVTWTGGTYRPWLSADSNGVSDRWTITGTLTVGGTAEIAPGCVDGENNQVFPESGMQWTVLTAVGGITRNAGPTVNPAQWIFVPFGNPENRWDLKSV
jgi:hypothetical protein